MNTYACVPLKARKPCRTFFCRCRCMSNELKKGSQQKSSGSEALFLQIFAYLFHPFDPLDPFLPMDFWFKGFFIWKNLEPTVLRLLMGRYFKQSRSWAVQGLSSWVGAVFSSETTRCSLLCVGVCVSNVRLIHFLANLKSCFIVDIYLIISFQNLQILTGRIQWITDSPLKSIKKKAQLAIFKLQVVVGTLFCWNCVFCCHLTLGSAFLCVTLLSRHFLGDQVMSESSMVYWIWELILSSTWTKFQKTRETSRRARI